MPEQGGAATILELEIQRKYMIIVLLYIYLASIFKLQLGEGREAGICLDCKVKEHPILLKLFSRPYVCLLGVQLELCLSPKRRRSYASVKLCGQLLPSFASISPDDPPTTLATAASEAIERITCRTS